MHSGDPCAAGSQCANVCNEAAHNCFVPSGTTCDDGIFCNGTDTCDGNGSCAIHSGDPCPGTECNTCNEGAKDCLTPFNTCCTDDGNPCTSDICDGNGSCTHPALPDTDHDGICDAMDNCPTVYNPDQADCDCNGFGDVCDLKFQNMILRRAVSATRANGRGQIVAKVVTAEVSTDLQACLLTNTVTVDLSDNAAFHTELSLTGCSQRTHNSYIKCKSADGSTVAVFSPVQRAKLYRLVLYQLNLNSTETTLSVPTAPSRAVVHACGVDHGATIKRCRNLGGDTTLRCDAGKVATCVPMATPCTPPPRPTPTPACIRP